MADLRALYTEDAVGAGHPTRPDVINRLTLAEHGNDGAHGATALASLMAAIVAGGLEDDFRAAVKANGFAGDMVGGQFRYTSAYAAEILAGEIEIGGDLYTITAKTSTLLTTWLGSSFTAGAWYFVYFNPATATGGVLDAADVVFSTTAPEWDNVRRGWYHPTNTTYRCPAERGYFFLAETTTQMYPWRNAGGFYWFWYNRPNIIAGSSPSTTLTQVTAPLPNLGIPWTVAMSGVAQDNDSDAIEVVIVDGSDTGASHEGDAWFVRAQTSNMTQFEWQPTFRTTNTARQIGYNVASGDNYLTIALNGFALPIMGGF